MAVNQTDRRALILEAAQTCFLRFGYAKTSMSDIAAECDLSRSLLYLHFKTKEDVFGALLERMFEASYQRARQVLAHARGKRERLLGVVEARVLELWAAVVGSPHVEELFAQGMRIYPTMAEQERQRSFELCRGLLPSDEVIEVFWLALKGLESDRPSSDVLRERCRLLVDLVLRS
jgi:TetR/AcrR family transcriptional regulator, transcriptional repressor of aconitase